MINKLPVWKSLSVWHKIRVVTFWTELGTSFSDHWRNGEGDACWWFIMCLLSATLSPVIGLSLCQPVFLDKKELYKLHLTCQKKRQKNSSIELEVIWGNFGFSDLGCFDLVAGLLWFGLLFSSKFSLFSLNIRNLGTYYIHTQMEQIWLNGTFAHCFTTISICQPKELPNIHFKFSIKNVFSTLTWAPSKNHVKIFKNQMSNTTTQTPIQ